MRMWFAAMRPYTWVLPRRNMGFVGMKIEPIKLVLPKSQMKISDKKPGSGYTRIRQGSM